ncbi:type I 3-dehydroquinate dehydratase [Natronomonas sp. CBA1123]|uniref:type I 3-dehydroquinate dehydratase n=1 Tax=Natronomonas sp. CBA1123 TaxID=2668070 RepID=UPI0012EAFA78|nr:type I 3-dehydroquinate dehydratase [Natronomonas sp. CBA1123]MUV87858.1 type I 3-dehydroquinate dehydratase [Natronomonas sp. CBA1123]
MTLDFDAFTLAAATADLDEEPDARAHADCVEFRMDLADSPSEQLAAYDGDLPLLVTNRADWEGGEASDEGRLDALADALAHPSVEAVDIELATLEDGDGGDLLDRADAEDVSVVVSTHDFEKTPSKGRLQSLLTRAGTYGDVAKLAVTAEDRSDALAVLSATHELTERGQRVATMAMGEAGSHTRAVAPVYGSKIGYAPVDPAKVTAPGQYDLETLRSLVDSLV